MKSKDYNPKLSPYEPIWFGKNDTQYPLYDMDTAHIEHALRGYRNQLYGVFSWHGLYEAFWVEEFTNELAAREGELERDPVTNQFMTLPEKRRIRQLQRVMLGLPPMKPPNPVESTIKGYTPPKVSLFG